MSRTIIFLPAARAETIDAHDWYEQHAEGVGDRFVDALDEQLETIAANPAMYPIVLADVRRVRLRRFPYSIFYRESSEKIFVIGCFHSSRDPLIWQDRTRSELR